MDQSGQEEYIRQVLDAYRKTPGPTGTARRPDRLLAIQLHQRGVPLTVVKNALVLAAARRNTSRWLSVSQHRFAPWLTSFR